MFVQHASSGVVEQVAPSQHGWPLPPQRQNPASHTRPLPQDAAPVQHGRPSSPQGEGSPQVSSQTSPPTSTGTSVLASGTMIGVATSTSASCSCFGGPSVP